VWDFSWSCRGETRGKHPEISPGTYPEIEEFAPEIGKSAHQHRTCTTVAHHLRESEKLAKLLQVVVKLKKQEGEKCTLLHKERTVGK